jgi:4-hydroxy-4-methyl-2-oxoglutarate aldolase
MSGAGQLEVAARCGTCAISDAMDVLGIAGVPTGLRWLSEGEEAFAGRAVTVLLGAADGTPSTRHLGTAAVASAGPADVIVVAHPGNACAGWGGLLSLAAKRRGIKGVVLDGPARDVDEARDLGFPVFATAPTPVTARGRIQEVSWGEPVEIAGIPVASGDLVVADANGVVFVPADRAEEVLARAVATVDREAAMAADVRTGTSITEVMGRGYEAMR